MSFVVGLGVSWLIHFWVLRRFGPVVFDRMLICWGLVAVGYCLGTERWGWLVANAVAVVVLVLLPTDKLVDVRRRS